MLAVLLTGYSKSLIFQPFAVAALIEREEQQTVVVVCPLKSILEDQIAKAESMVIPVASSVDMLEDRLRATKFQLTFGSAETVIKGQFLNILKDISSSLYFCSNHAGFRVLAL